MEYLQVFNDNHEAIDEKIERDNKYKLTNGKHFMVVLIFIENEKGEFLMQKTSKERGSVIATTGGHVTYHDTSLETVIKECHEELGLEIKEEELKYIDFIKYNDAYEDIYYTNKKIDIDKLVLQKEEVESIKWYSVDEIKDLIKTGDFRKGNINAFNLILKYRGYK